MPGAPSLTDLPKDVVADLASLADVLNQVVLAKALDRFLLVAETLFHGPTASRLSRTARGFPTGPLFAPWRLEPKECPDARN